MEEEKKSTVFRKIDIGRKYRIWRKDYNGKTFYNIMVEQKQYDDTKKRYYIPVAFKKGVSVANETDIRVLGLIENLRDNPLVEDKVKTYYPVFFYTITDFEECKSDEQIQQEAYDEYRENLNENETVDIDDDFFN